MRKPQKILIQFPTKGRPEKFLKYLARYIAYLDDKENYMINVSCDVKDLTMNTIRVYELITLFKNTQVRFGMNNSKIEAVNAGVDLFDWDICILASDDMWPEEQGYDVIIRELFNTHFPDGDGVLHFNDGRRGDVLNTLSIMGRKYYDRFGYLYNPIYKSLYADDEFDQISRVLDKRVYIAQVIIRHKHPSYSSGISDRLYKHNNTFMRKDQLVFKARKKINYGL